ncbi:MAG: hypothetical protein V1744_07275 [Candidatus Altiarchaeota archaeon]
MPDKAKEYTRHRIMTMAAKMDKPFEVTATDSTGQPYSMKGAAGDYLVCNPKGKLYIVNRTFSTKPTQVS